MCAAIQTRKTSAKAIEKGIHTLPDSHEKHYETSNTKLQVFSFLISISQI